MEPLIARGLLVAFLVFVAFFCLNNVIYTWDLIGYVGSAVSWSGGDPVSIQNITYSLVREGIPASSYEQLLSTAYGSSMSSNAEDFYSQLGMYAIKPLYVGAIVLLNFFGLSYIHAGILLSVLPAIAICILAYVWLSRYTSEIASFALVFVLLFASRLFDVARVITPDSLSALVLLFSIYAVVEGEKLYKPGLFMLVISVLIRSNNIIFSSLVLTYLTCRSWATQQRYVPEVVSLISAFALYLIVSSYFGHDWWRLFYHTFVGSIHNLESFNTDFSLQLYTDAVINRIGLLFVSGFTVQSVLFQFTLVSIVWAIMCHRTRHARGLEYALIAAMYLNVLAFALLFPLVQTWDRFFIPFYFAMVIFLVKACSGTETGSQIRTPVSVHQRPD